VTAVEEWEDDTPPAPSTEYATVESFVTDHLAVLIQRKLEGTITWCPQWQEHPEAVDRLTALWTAWEAMRHSPIGHSSWWLDHADPHLTVLMDANHGPFVHCSPEKGHRGERYSPLPSSIPGSQ
jgi:hypothetical protein